MLCCAHADNPCNPRELPPARRPEAPGRLSRSQHLPPKGSPSQRPPLPPVGSPMTIEVLVARSGRTRSSHHGHHGRATDSPPRVQQETPRARAARARPCHRCPWPSRHLLEMPARDRPTSHGERRSRRRRRRLGFARRRQGEGRGGPLPAARVGRPWPAAGATRVRVRVRVGRPIVAV
jgi:hypothetical protein